RSAMGSDLCLEEVDRLALGEGDDGPLGVGTLAVVAGPPIALALAGPVEGVHLEDLDVEDLLDRVVDLRLGGAGGHLEGVGGVGLVGEGVGLLAHDRRQDDVAGVLHLASSCLAPPRVTGRSTGSVSGVKTTQSLTSTS